MDNHVPGPTSSSGCSMIGSWLDCACTCSCGCSASSGSSSMIGPLLCSSCDHKQKEWSSHTQRCFLNPQLYAQLLTKGFHNLKLFTDMTWQPKVAGGNCYWATLSPCNTHYMKEPSFLLTLKRQSLQFPPCCLWYSKGLSPWSGTYGLSKSQRSQQKQALPKPRGGEGGGAGAAKCVLNGKNNRHRKTSIRLQTTNSTKTTEPNPRGS